MPSLAKSSKLRFEANELMSMLDNTTEENFLLKHAVLLKKIGVDNPEELINRSHDREFAEQLNRQILLKRGGVGELLSPGTREKLAEEKRHKSAVGKMVEGVRRAVGSVVDKVMPGRKQRRKENKDQVKERLVKRRMEGANQYGRRSDARHKRRVREFFPAYGKSFGQRNIIMGTHQIGDLLLIASDGERYKDNKVTHEAIRKVGDMIISADNDRATEAKKQQVGFFINLAEERFHDPNGESDAGTNTKWMVTSHNLDNDYKCNGYKFLDNPPLAIEDEELIDQIDFRSTLVTNEEGEVEKIRYMLDFDIKEGDSIDDKAQRHPDREIDEWGRDVVRAKALFLSERDADLVINEWVRRISKPDDPSQRSYPAHIEKRKNGVGVDENDPTKKAIPCNKFNLVVEKEGEMMDLEIQAFAPEPYRDYEAWKPHCWIAHKAKRYFESGLYDREYPEKIYGRIPIESLIVKMIDRGHQQVIEDFKEIAAPFMRI